MEKGVLAGASIIMAGLSQVPAKGGSLAETGETGALKKFHLPLKKSSRAFFGVLR
jgi:hypothetical protein